MSNIGLQIISSDSNEDFVSWKTTIPSSYNSFQVNSINNIPINLTYYLNSDYIEIQHNIISTPNRKIISTPNRKIYYQNDNGNGSFTLQALTELPPIRVNLNTAINNSYVDDQDNYGYKYVPQLPALQDLQFINFIDGQEKYFKQQTTTNRRAICFNNPQNEHAQKLSNNQFSLNTNYGQDIVSSAVNYINLRIDAFLYLCWIMDYSNGVAYRAIGLIRLYCPSTNNFITSVEPLASNAISVRYLFGKRINISSAGAITTSDDQPIDVQQQTMQQIINNINTFPMRIICSLPALTTQEWTDIYAAVGRTGFYGQFIAEVVSEWSQVEHIGVASLWFAKKIILSPNLYAQFVGVLDLYDGLNENKANQLVNFASSIKQIDLETWFYKTKFQANSLIPDIPIFCPFIDNFIEYPQILIICVNNQLKGITMETVGGNGFNNVCFKQNLVEAPVLWGQNMMSQECFIGQNKSVIFTLYDNFGRKIPTQFGDMYNKLLLEIQFQ